MAKPRYANIVPENMNTNAPASGFMAQLSGNGVSSMKVSAIKTDEPFVSLFPIREEVYQAIVDSIKENGFDDSQPLIIWREKKVLLDGHTRLRAAVECKLEKVPVINISFETEDEAIDYMYRLQFNRRNIKDSELIILAKKSLEKYVKQYGKGGKAEFLAKRFTGLSLTKAKKVYHIIENASEFEITQIMDEEITINKLFMQLKDVSNITKKVHLDFLNNPDPILNNEQNTSYSELPEVINTKVAKDAMLTDKKNDLKLAESLNNKFEAQFDTEIVEQIVSHDTSFQQKDENKIKRRIVYKAGDHIFVNAAMGSDDTVMYTFIKNESINNEIIELLQRHFDAGSIIF